LTNSFEKFRKRSDNTQQQTDKQTPWTGSQFAINIAPYEITDQDGSCHHKTKASKKGETAEGFFQAFPLQWSTIS
jgi:hypothetical protein